MKPEPPIRVLVVDDSAANRKAITAMLDNAPGVRVIDRAGDGEEGLRKAIELRPDVITLDLEMPRLDGYAFLRLLNARAPTPVIVLSSYGHPSDVFKALQLGAFDFVAKPRDGSGKQTLDSVRAELVEKVRATRHARKAPPPRARRDTGPLPRLSPAGREAPLVVVIGASTGGPPAVQHLLEAFAGLPVCALVAQHMPPRFTQAFAERLDQALPFRVSEAKSGDVVEAGRVYIAPGGEQLEVVERSGRWVLSVKAATASEKHAPSVDKLFESVARVVGGSALGVVLTGMGNDGARGVQALAKAGAPLWAESEATAAVGGMPAAAVSTGVVRHVYALAELAKHLVRALREAQGTRAK